MTMSKENETVPAERIRSRQRRDITNTIGFERYGIIENDLYEPPKTYPSDAQDYLVGLSQCGTLSGGAKIAGISVNRVYECRRKLEGFRDEEDIAKTCLTDALENSLFSMGLGLDDSVTGMARVKAVNSALEANRPEKYDRAEQHEIQGDVNVTWYQIMQRADKEIEEEKEKNASS